MDIEITAFYFICDNLLKSLNYQDNSQCRMSAAEVMTAAAFFGGDQKKICNFLKEYRHIPRMIPKSRFSRRPAGIPEFVWRGLADWLASAAHGADSLKFYIADSFPAPVCRNIRIRRCEIYQDECFRGRVSSRKEYFYGLKVHALMTESGIPVEIFFSLGSCSCSDTTSLYDFSFPVPSGNVIYGDKAYNACNIKEELEQSGIHLKKEKFKKKIRVIHRRRSQIHPKAHRISIQRHHQKISSAYSCCHLEWL